MAGDEIILQFVHENNIAGNMIAWFSHGSFSHVEAIWPSQSDMTYGSYERRMGHVPSGVRFRPVGYNKKLDLCVHCHIPVTAERIELWKDWMLKQFGAAYDWRAIWGFAAGRDWREEGEWICSELQARALEMAGILPGLYLATSRITPVALALAVSALPGVRFETIKGKSQ